LVLNEHVNLRFFNADLHGTLSSVDGGGIRFTFLCAANSADCFNTAITVLAAAAPRSFIRVTSGMVFPYLWGGGFCRP
jgi:hypothetical protein